MGIPHPGSLVCRGAGQPSAVRREFDRDDTPLMPCHPVPSSRFKHSRRANKHRRVNFQACLLVLKLAKADTDSIYDVDL